MREVKGEMDGGATDELVVARSVNHSGSVAQTSERRVRAIMKVEQRT